MPVPVEDLRAPATPSSGSALDPEVRSEPGARLEPGNHLPPTEDRWHWRRRIRADPRKRAVYRVLVGVAGTLFILSGLITGPLPGPGGIPLVLLGLAIWASEFQWAHRLMTRFTSLLHRFRGWSRPRQALFWVAFFAGCGALGWLYLVVLGVPTWMPGAVAGRLTELPGV